MYVPQMKILLAAHWGTTVILCVLRRHYIPGDTELASQLLPASACWLAASDPTPTALSASHQMFVKKEQKGVIRLFAASFVPLCLTWHSKEMTFKMLCWQAADYEIRVQQTVWRSDRCTTTTQILWKWLLYCHCHSSQIRNILYLCIGIKSLVANSDI